MAPISPMSWYGGSHETPTVSWEQPNVRYAVSRLWSKFPWLTITPFGSEVDPDVYWRKARVAAEDPGFCHSFPRSTSRSSSGTSHSISARAGKSPKIWLLRDPIDLSVRARAG